MDPFKHFMPSTAIDGLSLKWLSMSKTCTDPRKWPHTIRLQPCVIATHINSSLWPSNDVTHGPLCASHTFVVLSHDTYTIRVPSIPASIALPVPSCAFHQVVSRPPEERDYKSMLDWAKTFVKIRNCFKKSQTYEIPDSQPSLLIWKNTELGRPATGRLSITQCCLLDHCSKSRGCGVVTWPSLVNYEMVGR